MKVTWLYNLEGQDHTVTFETRLLGLHLVKVDLQTKVEETVFHNLGCVHKFEHSGHLYELTVSPGYLRWSPTVSLKIDQQIIPEKKPTVTIGD